MASSNTSNAGSSHQEQSEQKVLDVIFLCDEWKSSKGGLSTFNREFAINLAQATTGSMKIHCYVSNSDDRDREDAKQHGVNLITARSVPGSADPHECLKFPPSQLPNPHLVIGHGRKLGIPAYFLAQSTKCKWVQFVHVYCEDLGKYKESATAAEDTIEENEKKHKMEIDLCKAADAVVTVGSRLQQKYSRRLLNVEVKIITPGIFGKFSNESKLAVDRSVVKNFNVSLFGRAAFEDRSLKGYDVVANAIGSLGENFELTFVGSSPGEQRKVEQWFLDNTCINRKQLTIRRYCSEQEELKVMFYESDLVALPSRTEGFGLVALEAISAGVPVLVSGESGIAEALQKVEGGNTVIVGSGEDKDEWARRIREMYEESAEEREANAVKLRENYRKVYSWKAECERFKGLIENVVKTANGGKLNVKVAVDDLKPEEQNMQTGMLATESARCQGVQQPRASATSTASGSVSYSQKEHLNALEKEIFLSIVQNYLKTTPPQSPEEHSRFMEYTQKMKLIITGVAVGSLVIAVKCESLMILEELWTDYSSGRLGEVVQNCFVTEKILKELNLAELRLKTTIDIEEYNACKAFFEKDALRDVLSSEFHSTSSTSESPLTKEQWEKIEQKTKIMETAKLEDQKLNIKVDVEHMKCADQDAYNTASVLALEPAGYQKASTASGTKRKRHSDADLEDLQPLKKKVLCLIAMNYLDTTPAQSRDECNEFKEYLQEMKVFIIGVSVGSLVITVKCDSLSSLEELWEDYSCGLLDKMVRDCFVTEKILKELNLAELKLKIMIDKEDYNAYKLYFLEKDALRDALSSEFHSTSSTSESPQKQEELKKWKQKIKIVETEKLKGTSPLTVIPTTTNRKELVEKGQGRKGTSPFTVLSTAGHTKKVEARHSTVKFQGKKGSSPPPLLSTTDLEEKLGKVCEEIEMLRVKGTLPPPELFTADFEEELKRLCKELNRQRMKGSSPSPASIIKVVVRLQKVRMEALENAIYLTMKSGLAKFDVSLPEELQSYINYLLNESVKLGLRRRVLQSPRALEELREAMNKNELETFLTIHIREGAWQVVLLFMDELPKYKLPSYWYREVWDEDEEMFSIPLYSSTSGILRAWPTEYDPGLITLCKAITNSAWKVIRLILSGRRISDAGLKNLSTALTQSELYRVTLYGIGLQSQGLKHLCEALISGDCNLTCLNVSNNRLGDEEILHLCNPLTSVNCTLTSLNVSDNMLGDEGIVHLCNALTSVHCKLTSLNVSDNTLGDEGIMHLCNALTSVNCTLTSLNVSGNRLGDKGIKRLCKALTDTKCKLSSLNLHANWNVTDEGQKCLSQMLTGTDWEVRGGLRLSRSTKKWSKSQVSGTEP